MSGDRMTPVERRLQDIHTRLSRLQRMQMSEAAAAEFLSVYGQPIRRLSMRIQTGTPEEDVADETVLRVYQAARKELRKRGDALPKERWFRDWLYATTRLVTFTVRREYLKGLAAGAGDETIGGLAGRVVGGRVEADPDPAEQAARAEWDAGVHASLVARALRITEQRVKAKDPRRWRAFEIVRMEKKRDEFGKEMWEVAIGPAEERLVRAMREFGVSRTTIYEWLKWVAELFRDAYLDGGGDPAAC